MLRTMTPTRAKPRIVLYSHDTMGFGHVRRNLLIARSLVAPPLEAEVLLISGMREAGAFAMPDRIDCLTLPAYRKDKHSGYCARSLCLETDTLVALRSETIKAALKHFEPDLFVVDNVPRGVMGELKPVLKFLRRRGRTRCVLGLRDVLDDPETIRRQWWLQRNFEAVRKYYDAVWVYGDPSLYDTATEYGFEPEFRRKLTYTGYLDQSVRLKAHDADDPTAPDSFARAGERYMLCAAGGGQDGIAVTRAFAEAELPPNYRGIILTGPFMPAEDRVLVAGIAARNPRLKVVQFVAEPIRLILNAQRIIAMGGYNTIMEILSLNKRALVAPRVKPRSEQLIRAERLEALGLIDLVRPDVLTPVTLSDWLKRSAAPPPAAKNILDFGGLLRLPHLVMETLAKDRPTATVARNPLNTKSRALQYATV